MLVGKRRFQCLIVMVVAGFYTCSVHAAQGDLKRRHTTQKKQSLNNKQSLSDQDEKYFEHLLQQIWDKVTNEDKRASIIKYLLSFTFLLSTRDLLGLPLALLSAGIVHELEKTNDEILQDKENAYKFLCFLAKKLGIHYFEEKDLVHQGESSGYKDDEDRENENNREDFDDV